MDKKKLIIFGSVLSLFFIVGIILSNSNNFGTYAKKNEEKHSKKLNSVQKSDKEEVTIKGDLPKPKSFEERVKQNEANIKSFFNMLNENDYTIPMMFSESAFKLDPHKMNPQELMLATEAVSQHFLQGNKFRMGKIVKVTEEGDKAHYDIEIVVVDGSKTNTLPFKLTLDKLGNITNFIKEIKHEGEGVVEDEEAVKQNAK
ncbi:hypothetical protein CN931_25145 [Bacillus sp. AFS054943]|uniref:Uncharacterized protein n=1 Tax=Bacillus cereus TaxID=1396 RepID=A0A2C1LLY7_BACCE|nr:MULTISPECIES: hypothetical protein [Bacillus]PGL77241.1 hypothetical protein CN931_25145 [Bacillus sp. AFS054943]PGT99482.1 hypothetical protein COD19_19385 [Bacillus cereus]TKI39095.1 hypothetical protein FC700_21805 [Bacillus mycoides]